MAPELFAGSGVLGTYGSVLTLADAEILGRAFGTLVRRRGGASVALCFDCRHSSPDLAATATIGLLRSGIRVFRLGCGSLPFLSFGARSLSADAALMVSGLDADPSANGLQFYFAGRPLDRAALAVVAELASTGDFLWGVGRQEEAAVFARYLVALERRAPAPGSHVSVLWDAGNGAVGRTLALLLRRLPGRHLLLNESMDGSFPARQPWRSLEAAAMPLRSAMRAESCDLAFAFDAAGAQAIALDSDGRQLELPGARESPDPGPSAGVRRPAPSDTVIDDPIAAALQVISQASLAFDFQGNNRCVVRS